MLDKEFVPYQESFELKELGFDEPVEFFKDSSEEIFDMRTPNDAPCILWQQAFRWFREKYCLVGIAQYFTGGYYCYTVNDMKNTEKSNRLFTEFDTYEEAELTCLRKLIEIVKQQKLNHDLMSGDIVGY